MIENNKNLKSAIRPDNWVKLSLEQRNEVAKQVPVEYAKETGTLMAYSVRIDPDLPDDVGAAIKCPFFRLYIDLMFLG